MIVDRKAVLIGDFANLLWKKYAYSKYSLEIGEQKLYYALMGHPINKEYTETRVILLKM